MASKSSKQIVAKRMSDYGIKAAGIKPGETLEQAHRRLAKQADQRLVRLEQLSQKEGYKGVLTYSYGLAQKNAEIYGATGEKKRFNIAMPKSKKQLQAKINDMIQFLNSPTSTKGGIDKMYKKRTQTLNDKYGTDFTWQEAGQFFESQKDTFKKKMDSGIILKSIGKLQQSADIIKGEIEQFTKAHKVVDDKEVDDIIFDLLKKNNIKDIALLPKNESKRRQTIHNMLAKADYIPKEKAVKSKKKPRRKK